MSKWTNKLLDFKYMKRYANELNKMIEQYISMFDMIDEARIKDAVMIRYELDKILLDEFDREAKWGQPMVHSFETGTIIFRDTEQECIDFMNKEKHILDTCEIYFALPDDIHFSWNRYFKELENRCSITIISYML